MDVNGMKITDVIVYPVKRKLDAKSKLMAFAKVVLNDQFIIHGIRIYEGVNGAFMTFPQDYQKKNKDGKPYDICHPTTAELRNYIDEQVMAEYALTENQKENKVRTAEIKGTVIHYKLSKRWICYWDNLP